VKMTSRSIANKIAMHIENNFILLYSCNDINLGFNS
jgi:hypothetical protein